jgi:hypothetical protein
MKWDQLGNVEFLRERYKVNQTPHKPNPSQPLTKTPGLEPDRQSPDRTHSIHESLSQFRRRRPPNLGLWIPRDASR